MATAREKEFFAIRLVDLGQNVKPRFLIREIHGAWSDSEHRIKWNVDCDALCCFMRKPNSTMPPEEPPLSPKGSTARPNQPQISLMSVPFNGRMDFGTRAKTRHMGTTPIPMPI
jgi:hypothetical protein